MSTVQELDKQLFELKLQALAAARKKAEYYRDRRLELFVPHTLQKPFFRNSNKKRRGVFAGNRWGKSEIGVVEDCSWLLGERLFYPKGHPLRTLGIPTHGVKGILTASDWDKVDEVFTNTESEERQGKFFKYLPQNHIKETSTTQTGVIKKIIVENLIDGIMRTSMLDFETVKSFKNDPLSIESGDYDFIHVDEPMPEEMWKALSRGLMDRNGYSWWLMTSLKFPWMYEEALEGSVNDPDIWWMAEGSTDDNPLLTEEAKRLYFDGLPEDELACRRQGRPLSHGRLVYGNYRPEKHLWETSKRGIPVGWVQDKEDGIIRPPRGYLCGYSIDPHPQTPHACLFTAIAPTGQVFFFHELFEKATLTDFAKKILNVLKGCRIGFQLCDPIAWIEDPETGKCWADAIMAVGLDVQKASKAKSTGIIQTNDLFASDRRIFVLDHLRAFRREIKKYFFDREDKPIDKDDHLMECLYRTVVHDGLQWYPELTNEKPLVYADDEFKQATFDLPTLESIKI